MDTITALALAGAFGGLALLGYVRINRGQQTSDDLSHGDWPHVPAEMLGERD